MEPTADRAGLRRWEPACWPRRPDELRCAGRALGLGIWAARRQTIGGGGWRFISSRWPLCGADRAQLRRPGALGLGSTHGGEEFYQAQVVPKEDLGTSRQGDIVADVFQALARCRKPNATAY